MRAEFGVRTSASSAEPRAESDYMSRFVVLTHDHPKLHWDFMLEREGVLRTWRLAQPPDTQGVIRAEALPDHRIAYLDYEGPVSRNRGTVQRWDAGTYETVKSTRQGLAVDLAGEKLAGVIALRQSLHFWSFWQLPPGGPDRVIEIPQLLTRLIAEGRWPATGADVIEQELSPLVSKDRVSLLAPEETQICLYPPPFHTVRELALDDPFWCEPLSDPSAIDFDQVVAIGDFGIGSDSPILLDCPENFENPRVIRLRCSERENKWVLMAEDFPTFVNVLGL
jgi:DNA polymerase ligase (LigD)-like protein